MARRRETTSAILEPDMTPMIDCVFQLLTFFMIAINFENTKADERVKLPMDQLAKPPEVKPETELVLNIGFQRDKAGQIVDPSPLLFYNDQSLRIQEFGPFLEQERRLIDATKGKEGISNTTVILRADGEVPTGVVQQAIKMCQDNGFFRFALKATQDER